MVMQSEYTEQIITDIVNATHTLEIGESASVDYSDNDLDTVALTKTTGIDVTSSNNSVNIEVDIASNEASGADINAILYKLDGLSLGKFLHTTEVNDANTSIFYRTKIFVIPDFT